MLKRSDYDSYNDYCQALLEAGGPSPSDFKHLVGGVGEHAAMLHAIYGFPASEDVFLKETRAEQRRKRHRFVSPHTGGRPPQSRRPRH